MKKILKVGIFTYLIHISTVFLTFMMLLPLAGFAGEKPMAFSAITSVIYAVFMYNLLWKTGEKDARKIKGFYPDKTFPLKVSLFTAIVPLALLGIRIFVPDLWRIDVPMYRGEASFFIKGLTASGVPDFIFKIWNLHLGAFIPADNIFAYALSLLYLPFIIFVSYYIGLKRFRIVEYLYIKLMFKSGKEDKLWK